MGTGNAPVRGLKGDVVNMRIVFTGAAGNLGYWDATPVPDDLHAFGVQGHFKRQGRRSFARLHAVADNNNYAPIGYDGAVTSDLSLVLLYRIAAGA